MLFTYESGEARVCGDRKTAETYIETLGDITDCEYQSVEEAKADARYLAGKLGSSERMLLAAFGYMNALARAILQGDNSGLTAITQSVSLESTKEELSEINQLLLGVQSMLGTTGVSMASKKEGG